MKLSRNFGKYLKLSFVGVFLAAFLFFFLTRNTGKAALEKAKTQNIKQNEVENEKLIQDSAGKLIEEPVQENQNTNNNNISSNSKKSQSKEELLTKEDLDGYCALDQNKRLLLLFFSVKETG